MITDIILASGSPRRRELLDRAGIRYTVFTSNVDESLDDGLRADPPHAAEVLAQRKAGAAVQALLAQPYLGQATVIGADTMVVLDGRIFGKPKFAEDAKDMLRCLSGRTHQVITGVAVWRVLASAPGKISVGHREFHVTSSVTFKDLSEQQIADYVASGECRDKAGAYAIQGEGAKLVASYEGDYDNIVGLPVGKLLELFPDLRAPEN